jgi:hypothetical protein
MGAAWLGEALVPAVLAGGAVTFCRCMPADLPPPRRRAASASKDMAVIPRVRMTAKSASVFLKRVSFESCSGSLEGSSATPK